MSCDGSRQIRGQFGRERISGEQKEGGQETGSGSDQ